RYCAWMRERASGIDDRPVLAEVEDKSLSAEDTFEEDIGEPRTLQRQLARVGGPGDTPPRHARVVGRAALAASRLRKRGLMAGCIGVKIRRGDFTTFTRQRAVAPPACDRRTIGGVAPELLNRWLAGNPGAKLRLLGVVLTELTPASQLGLFEEPKLSGV